MGGFRFAQLGKPVPAAHHEVERVQHGRVLGTVDVEGGPRRECGVVFERIVELDVPFEQRVELLDGEIPEL